MSTGPGHTHMFNIQNIYATPPVSRRQVIKPRRLTLIDLRNLTGAEEEGTQRKGSSGTIKSESGISNLKSAKQICDVSEAPRRPVATMKVKNITTPSSGFSVANSGQVKLEQTRFPKLEEYAHFHYDLVEIPTLKLSLCTDDASGYKHNTELSEDSGMFLVTVLGSAPKSWLIKRSLENFATLDIQLHRCIFDRRFSRLNDLSAASLEVKPRQELLSILHSYLTHLSELAGGMINCGSVLSWMEMDNRGHRLVATDDSGINTPAIAAAHVIKRYSAQAADEITLQVGDMISVIDMPSAEDTIWWRGKRGFEVGFFPAECVEIIGDKIPTSMATRIPEPVATASASRRPCEILEELSTTTITATPSSSSTPSPSSSRYSSTTSSLVGNLSLSSSSAESSPAMMKKHGKLLSFLRTFFSHRPPRNQLKQSGIVKERVFGCDLGEHLLNSGHDVPLLLKSCTDIIEEYGIVHGIYRLSGITSNIQKLRLAFDEDRVPDLTDDCYLQDIHSISSLLKMYFRELPNPLLTYQLYDKFADAVRDEDNKLLKIHDVVQQLPPPHYRTTEYLMRHLARVAAFGHETEMHSKNLAIVWAPNLLRSKELEAGGGAAALQGVGIQAVVTECLICYCDIIFSDKLPDYSSQDSIKGQKKARPKSLAISTPTRLLSLEEARERAFVGHMAPKKFIDVGGGPRNLPSKYHTVIDLPGYRKRAPSTSSESKPVSGNKKASTTCGGGGGGGGWKSIFIKPRSGSIKKSRKCAPQDSMALNPAQGKALTEEDVHNWKRHLRSAKSAESLFSLMNTHSSHGSLSSRASASVSETVSHVVPELASKFQLSHKRSLSSDASTVLHHCCSTTGEGLQSQSPDDQDKQSFKRGDSARKALHRRLPSAPSTPLEDRKSVRETVSSVEAAASGDMSSLDFSHSQYDGDMNIHAKINSRLLQVAEKSRSAKSQEEFTSPLKRMAKCSPKGSKKAKGAGDFQMGSSDDELSNLVTETKVADSSSCVTETSSPNHSSGAVRAFYSRVHDYAEIVSDDDLAVLSTPDSQGAMSVSSSGCNMQDVLDQIDTRLALNAKLFPRQGIGDTSGYRVGDPPLSCFLPRSKPTTGLDSDPALAVPTSVSQETAQTELSVCADDLYVTDLPRELCQSSVDGSDQHMLPTLAVRQEHNTMRTGKTTASSTLVGRRHTEFIPSMTAAAKDLHNLHELLNSLTADDSQAKVRVLSRNQKSSRNSIVHTHHDHSATRMSQQKPPLSGSGSQFAGTQVPGPLAHVSAGVGGGGMSKCLSVPSDIARSLENVTGSQSDLLSSVTISELSASINSFSNGLGQEAAIVADAARAQIESADRRHRRSTSLDSLTENDRLMTRTLREINSQMEAAFQHNKVSSSGCSLDSLAHHQRLAVSDLELTSAGLSDHRATLEITADVNHRTCSHNHLYFSQSKMATSGGFDGSHPSAETAKSAPAHKLSHETVNSHDFVSETRDSVTAPCHLLSIVDKHAICDLSPTSCFISSQLNPGEEQQLCEVRQPADFNDVTCLDSTCDQQSRLTEKQTHRQIDEHIVIETTHVVKFTSPQPDRTSQQYRHPTASSSRQQHAHSRSDIASVCTNRSSSSSSGTSSEDYDEVAELSEDVSHKCHFSLPLGTVLCPTGNICGVVDNLAAGSTVQPAHNSTDRQHQAALHVSLPASDSAQYQVVRRQHSPRVEQRSQRFHLNIDGTKADFDDCQDSVATNDRWKPLFTSDSHVDDSETCERMSSLCAVGLMSQRARLSRDSSVSSLHSPDTCSPCVLASSAQSPLTTPVREALPDLIQSTAQTEATDADNRRCSAPLQLALYHPDEFSVDIAASVSSYTPSSRSTPLHPSASLPQVHSLSHTVVVTKSTLTKSSTDNSLCEVTRADRTVSGRHPGMAGWHRREADSHDLMLDTFDVADTQTLSQSASFSYTDPDGIKEENISKQNMQACRDEAYDAFNQDLINKPNHMLRPSRSICCQDFSSQVAVEFNNLSNRPMDDHQAAHFADSQPQASAIDSKLPLLLSSTDREPASAVDSQLSSSSTDRESTSAVDSKLSSSSTDREPASAVDSQLSSSSTDREPASAVDSQLSSSSTDREPASAVDSQLSSSSTDREMHHTDHMAVGIEVMETGPPCTDDKYALRSHASLDTDDKYALRSHASPDTDAQMFFLYNSDPAMEKEEVQNVVNQGREILMSPELIDKSEQREKLYQSLQSPSTGPVRRTSFSKIPRPRQNTELTSPRPANNGGRKNEFQYSSPMTSSVHVDTSPSSSSSSTSSSSRVGHTRRGSEASHGSTTNRQCHIRRSSDTKLTDLQTVTPASRGNSSSSNRPDLSGTGRPVTSPRNRGSEYKTGSTDIGVKSSRIPLSHRIPSPQSNRGTDSTNVAISKQISKIPSPVPKPRKLNLNSKGSLTTVPVEGNSCVRQCKTDSSGRVSSSKTPAVKRDAESNSKKAMIVKDMPSKCGAQLLIESQSDMTKAQTIHATKVSLPTRQVAGPEPAAEPSMASVQLEHENSTLTVTSGEIARTQSHLQTEVRAVGGDRKTPPPVAARQFTYDSRSLPRRSKLLETQVSFPGQQSCCELYSDMLGSRSSLDDSVLQLAAERHDLFVPGVSENGGSCGNCLSSLRVKRSQKMQSLMDLFERGSDSNVSDSSGPHSPGTQHRVRTCSGSVSVQGGMLTPCVEAGLGDLSTVDDDTFWPPTSECDDTWSRERFPSRAGTCSGHDDSSQEKPDSGGQMRVQGKHHACMCTSVIQPPGRETFHGSRAEQRSVSRKQATETTTCQRSPSTFDSCSNNLKPPHSDQLPGSRTRSNSSSDPCTVHPVFTSRPSSFSGTDLQLRAAGHPHLTDTHLALAFDRQHPNFAFIDTAHRQTDMAQPLYEIDNAHHADNELHATVTSSRTSSGNTPPASPRKNTERRNSIKELRQLFERGDADVSTATDNGLSNSDGQPTVARSRVRSISPQTDHGTKRDQLVRLSLEIASSTVACQSSQSEVKLQPLRLGPKPFYGAHK